MASETPDKPEQAPAAAPETETTAPDGGDMTMEGTAPATDAPADGGAPAAAGEEDDDKNPVAPGPELKLPTHKDVSLRELLNKMDDSAPIVSLYPH